MPLNYFCVWYVCSQDAHKTKTFLRILYKLVPADIPKTSFKHCAKNQHTKKANKSDDNDSG